MLTPSPKTTANKLKKRLGKWIDSHSECGKWLSYQDNNGYFYARESHKDKKWIVYKRTNKGTQLTCINTIKEYQPTKHSISVRIHTAAGVTIYRELGADLKIDDKLLQGPVESFEQLRVDQPPWIRDLIEFVAFDQTNICIIRWQPQSMMCSRPTTKMDF